MNASINNKRRAFFFLIQVLIYFKIVLQSLAKERKDSKRSKWQNTYFLQDTLTLSLGGIAVLLFATCLGSNHTAIQVD